MPRWERIPSSMPMILPLRKRNTTCKSVRAYFVDQKLDAFKTYHFHARPLLYEGNFTFPTGLDLLLLKAMGKGVFFHFRGSEIRLSSVFRECSPYNYVDEQKIGNKTEMPFCFEEADQVAFRDFVMGVCDGVFVNDPELQCYAPNTLIVPRGIEKNIDKDCEGEAEKGPPLIVHAPSRRGVKGTKTILESIEVLRKQGVEFEFQLVENMSHKDAMAYLPKARPSSSINCALDGTESSQSREWLWGRRWFLMFEMICDTICLRHLPLRLQILII
jgi:hypothetical protein